MIFRVDYFSVIIVLLEIACNKVSRKSAIKGWEKMKFATIGTSWIAEKFIKASKEVNDFELYAVYSRSIEKAKEFAGKYSAQFYFDDLQEMGSCEDVDCVYIASPNSLHYQQAIGFLKQKKHVICEKPIFSNTTELNEAYRIAEENDVYLFEAIRNIYSPSFEVLKESVEKVGKVRSCILHRNRYSSQYDNYLEGKNPNVFSLDFSGGALVDMGIYPLYLIVTMFGKPINVSYTAIKLESGVDGSGVLLLTYDGFTCTIMCSKTSTSYIPCEIQGENGTISFEHPAKINNLKYIDRKTKQTSAIDTMDVDQDMIYEIEHFKGIIESNDNEDYQKLKETSLQVLTITETARMQNDIVYGCES